MSIAIKDNAVILKDGKVTEGCNCCNNICRNPPDTLHMTVTGMPRTLGNPYAARSPFDDNGATLTLHKEVPIGFAPPRSCVWRAGTHGHVNRMGQEYLQWARWELDAANDVLYGYGNRFRPPDGASFRNLPYTDERPLVVDARVDNDFGSASEWSNVIVVIDEGASDTTQWVCPEGTAQYTTLCDIGQQSIITPCSAKTTSFDGVNDLSVSVDVSGEISQVRTVGTVSTEWIDIGDSVFANGSNNQTEFDFLSGDYDLAWKQYSGVALGGTNRKFGVPDGWQFVSEGYSYLAPSANPGKNSQISLGDGSGFRGTGVWLHVAIKPTAFSWTGDSPPQTSRCGDAQVAWGVNCVIFQNQFQGGIAVPAVYASGGYATSGCSAYSCAAAPSIDVTISIDFIARLNAFAFGPWTEVRGPMTVKITT